MFVYPGVLPPETLNTWPHGIVQYLTEDLFANTSLSQSQRSESMTNEVETLDNANASEIIIHHSSREETNVITIYPTVIPSEPLNNLSLGISKNMIMSIIDSSRTLETRVSVSSLRAPLFEVIEVPCRMSVNHLIGAAVNQIVQGDDDHNADIIWNKEGEKEECEMTTKPPSTVFLRDQTHCDRMQPVSLRLFCDQTHCDRIGSMAMQPLSLRVPWVHYIITEMKGATDLLEDRG